jgi:hypothetical protein
MNECQPQDSVEVARYRLAKARETLDDARFNAEHNRLFTATSRLYYACFYAVTAWLVLNGFTPASHSDVLRLFCRNSRPLYCPDRKPDGMIMLTDSSKLGRAGFAYIMPASRIDILITDAGAPAAEIDGLRKKGVDMRLV